MVKRYVFLIPLFIISVTIFYALYIVNTTNIIFADKHYLGFAFWVLSLIASLKSKKLGVCFTGIMLLLGTLNVIAFTPVIGTFNMGFSVNETVGVDLKLQLYSLMVLLVYVVINFRYIKNEFRNSQKK